MINFVVAETPFGVPATYWTIAGYSHDFESNKVEVFVKGFVSKEAVLAGKQPIVGGKTSFPWDNTGPVSKEGLYEVLVHSEAFEGATLDTEVAEEETFDVEETS